MPRLYIGSYIIDSADTSSSSTTSGVQLDLDEEESAQPRIRDGEYRWPIMYAVVTAASESALKTAVDALRDAVLNCSGKEVKYENTNGTTMFNMPSTIWPEAEGAFDPDYDGLTCDVAFSIIGKRPGAISNGAADEPGQIGPIEYQYEVTGGGLGGFIVSATFGPTLSGDTITAGARENAVVFINKMLNTANYPAWLSPAFRCVGIAPIAFDRKANLATVAESSYDPAVVSMTFRELAATLFADAAFPTTVKSANWNVDMQEREPIDVRSGQIDPGNEITLFGDLLLKTEGNTTFNSSESSLADNAIEAACTAAVDSIVNMFKAVYASLTPVQLGSYRLNIDAIQGVCAFSVTFLAAGTILMWKETGMLVRRHVKARSRASNGADTRYVNKGGPVKTLTHELTIQTQGAPQPYKTPSLSKGWDQDDDGIEPVTELSYRNGFRVFTTRGQSHWTFMNDGPTNVNPDRETVANQALRWDSIGNGDN
jgi:hypothetical protein